MDAISDEFTVHFTAVIAKDKSDTLRSLASWNCPLDPDRALKEHGTEIVQGGWGVVEFGEALAEKAVVKARDLGWPYVSVTIETENSPMNFIQEFETPTGWGNVIRLH